MTETTDPGVFAASISEWVKTAGLNFDSIARTGVENMCDAIISQHPVDDTDDRDAITSRDSWVAGVDAEAGDDTGSNLTGSTSKARVSETVLKWSPSSGQTFYFTNYKIQSVLLEYGLYTWVKNPKRTANGFSTQAPSGFVGINVDKFDSFLQSAVRSNNGNAT